MSTSATLAYAVTVVGPVSETRMRNALQQVDLATAIDAINTVYDTTLSTDTTVITGGGVVTRTLVFALGGQFNAMFPTGSDKAAPWRNVFLHIIGGQISSKVTAAEPVIA